MGAQVGGRKGGKRRLAAEINVVPYIDVMLVLLVIFMITAPLLQQGVKVDLPNTNSKPLDQSDEEPLIISIKKDGSYYINLGEKEGKEQSIDLAALKDKVTKVRGAKPNTPVMVWGDKDVPYGTIVELMSELQQAGVPDVGLVTEPR
jgi:biopolymer transport protein TolR